MQQKVGIGYDIHRFAKGKKLFLGGVEIPYTQGLEGHSDADVLIHALCDALLGALGKGDIGERFPNTDPQYKGISSLLLLEKVSQLVRAMGFTVSHVDTVIHAEEPNLKEYKPKMRIQIARKLAIAEEAVNIKATTHEGLGPIGEKKGIAALAVVLLVKE